MFIESSCQLKYAWSEMEKMHDQAQGQSSRASGTVCFEVGSPPVGPDVLLEYCVVQNCEFEKGVLRKPGKGQAA